MESTNSEFENLDTPDSFFSTPDKLANIISRAIINIKNSESDHQPRAKRAIKIPVAYVINQCVKIERVFSEITVIIGFMQNVMAQQSRNISS